ncbi:bifunctional lytic transglycosylase/C40 family peptidase [Streptomyces sp. NPDC020096]
MKRSTIGITALVGVLAVAMAGLFLVSAAVGAVSQGEAHEQQDTAANASAARGGLKPGAVPAPYAALVQQWGGLCPTLTPAILAAQLQTESNWDPHARSGAGAEGIAQFLPSTWATHGIDANGDGRADIWDPADAIPSAATYDCDLAKQVHDVPGDATSNMLAAYNAGPQAVRDAEGIPPNTETQSYVKDILALATTFASAPVAGSGAAATAVNAALSQQGVPYSWGGGGPSGPTTGSCCTPGGHSGANIRGFDCSGLTQYAYAQAGIALPRTAAEQAGVGRRIPASAGISALAPGDLVFFGYDPSNDQTIYHVGIYLGNGQMINAARPGTTIKIDPVAGMMSAYAGGTRLA